MNLDLSEESSAVRDAFERFFAAESTPARVRAAEPVGFDPQLWRQLVELEAPFMRLSAGAGGGGMGFFDAALVMEQAGRRLAPAPLAEVITTLRVLGEIGGERAQGWIDEVRGGEAVVTLALHEARPGRPQLVPGGAAAKAVLAFDGRELAIEVAAAPLEAPPTLGGAALGVFTPGAGPRQVLAQGATAKRLWDSAREEWKLLTAAALVGLSREAVTMAAAYACERIAFGQPIGVNQGVAHPLANDIIDIDGASLLLWRTLRAIADRQPDAGASVSLAFWWAARTAAGAVKDSLHTFGGYGLTNEYDIQLYHRRAKAWVLPLGDPEDELLLAGRRLFLGEEAVLPDPGAVEIEFAPPPEGEALARETRALFERVLTPEIRARDDHSFEGHDWGVHQALGEARLLYPDWPEAFGGRGASAAATQACFAIWEEMGYTAHVRSVTSMVGHIVMAFASDDVKQEVLPALSSGRKTASLGYTEPSGGSDVFAAKTRAVRDPDGDGWIINGQKMFTSGAELASYVLLIARTDPDAPKHKGITLFLVPRDAPGVSLHPVHTFMDERTNATFYDNVRLPDRFRLGEVNGGAKVLGAALRLEQSGGNYHRYLERMFKTIVAWARETTRNANAPVIEDPRALVRLARVAAHVRIAEVLSARDIWASVTGRFDPAFGPAWKVFSTESFVADAADLLDLAAPDSLLRSRTGAGAAEDSYRHSAATTIYGGASEVLRSVVAERQLGLPRSRG
jgi:alkylation response protein AidB-like acyl-CoA dehydrogenase